MITKKEPAQGLDSITTEMLDSIGIPTIEHAIQYLQKMDCEKDLYSRLIPYFLQLEVIPKDQKSTRQWAKTLSDLCQSYLQAKSNFQFEIQNPISEQISNDIKTSFPLFNEYCRILKINNANLNEDMFHNFFQIFQKEK